jgi:hypothetical protein
MDQKNALKRGKLLARVVSLGTYAGILKAAINGQASDLPHFKNEFSAPDTGLKNFE